jgi:transposase
MFYSLVFHRFRKDCEMGRKGIRVSKIKEILRLHHSLGLSHRQIAKALAVSRPVVAQYVKGFNASGLSWETAQTMAESELRAALAPAAEPAGGERYQALAQRFAAFEQELKKTGVTQKLLWEEYRAAEPEGYSYAQFCCHFAAWRQAQPVTMHIGHKAGEKMFVDFAGDRLALHPAAGGAGREYHVFIAVLGASGLTYAEPRAGQTTRDWIEGVENALYYFGGVPHLVVPDNASPVVHRADRYEPLIAPLFAAFAEHCGMAVLPARVRHPRDKALAENGVRLVYQRIYAPLRNGTFETPGQLAAAVKELLDRHNETPLQRLGVSRRELFAQVERAALRPLPARRFLLREVKERKVQFNYHVELHEDRHYYSVPWQFRQTRVKLIYDDRVVEIYHDGLRIAQHLRDRTRNGYTTEPAHLPPQHREYGTWDQARLLAWARRLGDYVAQVVSGILQQRQHPEQAYKVCMGLLSLAKRYDAVRLDRACRRALNFNTLSYRRIEAILAQGLEDAASGGPAADEPPLPMHENVRGSDYYQ